MSLPVTFTFTLTGGNDQLPANPLFDRITITAIAAGTNTVLVSANSAPAAANAATLTNGQSVEFIVGRGNTNQFYVKGTSGDKVSVAGV